MNWSNRIPSPAPSIDTMDNVAFWGTLVDGERLLATFGSQVLTFSTSFDILLDCADLYEEEDVECYCEYDQPGWWKADSTLPFSWETPELRNEFVAMHENINICQWLKTPTLNVYALVQLGNGAVGMYRVSSGTRKKHGKFSWEFGLGAPISMNLGLTYFDLYTDGLRITLFEEEGVIPFEFAIKWLAADDTKRLEVEMCVVESQIDAGKGWNSTRNWIIQEVQKVLR